MFKAHYGECFLPPGKGGMGAGTGVKDKGDWDDHSPLYRLPLPPPPGKGGMGSQAGSKGDVGCS